MQCGGNEPEKLCNGEIQTKEKWKSSVSEREMERLCEKEGEGAKQQK
jgi:hypothetical protein